MDKKNLLISIQYRHFVQNIVNNEGLELNNQLPFFFFFTNTKLANSNITKNMNYDLKATIFPFIFSI